MMASESAKVMAAPEIVGPVAPRTFTERARRVQILRAAADTVNDVGYPRASLSAIAAHAGVAKSAIGYYFASKDALLMELLEQVFGELDEWISRADDPEAPPVARLRTYAATYLGFADVHRAQLAAAIEIVVSHRTADGVPLYLTATEEDSALLRAILAAGMERGEFRQMPMGTAVGLVEALLDVPVTEIQRDLGADLAPVTAEILRALPAMLAP